MFKLTEQLGLQELDVVYEAVPPEGRPVVEKETACGEPELIVAMTVLVTDCPCVTDTLPPLLKEKLKVGMGPVISLQASFVYPEAPAVLKALTR